MSLLLAPVVELYRFLLQPVAPFTWFGLSFSLLDVAAATRTCTVLRQFREQYYTEHAAKLKVTGGTTLPETQARSFVRDMSATLMVAFGGEAILAPLLGVPASFMVSGVGPAFYATIQAIINHLPVVPVPSIETELPISVLDGFARAMMLCTLVPPMVVTHPMEPVASSPWTLLIASLVIPNGGWFFVNMTSFLHPYALTLTTPPEISPYGWTSTDLWCAPLITGIYALLTHAQPFWANAHGVVLGWIGAAAAEGEKLEPVDPEYARALCALILVGMFTTRTVKNFGVAKAAVKPSGPKTKVQ